MTWASGVWQALAVTLAEPIRKAFREHHASCSIARTHGIAYCDECRHLMSLYPRGEWSAPS